MPNNITLPQLIIFALETICTDNRMYIRERPFISGIYDKRVFDSSGHLVSYCIDAHKTFETLKHKGVGIGFVFNYELASGREFIEKSKLDKYIPANAKWWSKPEYYNVSSTDEQPPDEMEQINMILQDTRIPYEKIIFFSRYWDDVHMVMVGTGIFGHKPRGNRKLNLINEIGTAIRRYMNFRNRYSKPTTVNIKECWEELEKIILKEQ